MAWSGGFCSRCLSCTWTVAFLIRGATVCAACLTSAERGRRARWRVRERHVTMTEFEAMVHLLPEPSPPQPRHLTRGEVEVLYPGVPISEAYGQPVPKAEDGTVSGHNGLTLGHQPENDGEKPSICAALPR
jgi:hypothetical protein